VSDLGNGGWPNSMKLGEDIDLDELLLNPVPFWGLRVHKKPIWKLTFEYHYSTCRKLTEHIMV